MSIKIGVSPLSWTNEVLRHLGDNISAAECLSQAHKAGYSGIEMGRKLPSTVEKLSPLLGRYGLALVSGWHSGFLTERSVEEEIIAVRPLAELFQAMECNVLVYGECGYMVTCEPFNAPMPSRLKLDVVNLPVYALKLSEFARHLNKIYGLRLAFHHHLMTVVETLDEITALFNLTGPEVGLLLDTGHAFAAGFDYTKLLDRFGDLICHIHLKDVRKQVLDGIRPNNQSFNQAILQGMFTVPGDGDLDFCPIADFVKTSGYDGWLVVEAEQDPKLAPPFKTVSRARTFIDTLLG